MSDVTYRPSMVVNITLVFDERLLVPQRAAAATSTPQLPNSQRNAQTLGEHLVMRRGDANRTFILNRVPKKASVDFRGHRQAATWNLTFDRIELPIDPRTVRAAAVEIHLGSVSDANFAEGIQRVRPDGTRMSVLQTRLANGQPNDDTLIMVGPVDKWTTDESSGGSEISLEGRDIRGLLLDSPLISPFDDAPWLDRSNDPPQRPGARPPSATPPRNRRRRRSTVLSRLDPSKPIDVLVKQILYEHDRLRNMPVVCDPTEWPNGVVPSPTKDSTRHRRGARGGGGAASGGASDMNYWDLITRYCQPKDSLICRDDFTWAPIGEIKVGDRVLGFAKERESAARKKFHKLIPATVEAVSIRRARVVKLHMESGRVVKCTADHQWFTGRSEPLYEFKEPKVGRELVRVFDAPAVPFTPDTEYKLGYMRGLIDGDGSYINKVYEYKGRKARTKFIMVAMNDSGSLARYAQYCREMGLTPREGWRTNKTTHGSYEMPYVRLGTQSAIDMLVLAEEPQTEMYLRGWLAGIFDAEGCTAQGLTICQHSTVNRPIYDKIAARLKHFGFKIRESWDRVAVVGGAQEVLRFYQLVQPAAVFKFQRHMFGARMEGTKDRVLRIEECGEEDVVSLQTTTETYFGQGYASHNCFLVGAIPTIRGRVLYIRPARSLFAQLQADLNGVTRTPFHPDGPRTDDSGRAFHVRKMVYGHGIEKMNFSRKYAGHAKPKVVRTVSIDHHGGRRGHGRVIEAWWPPRRRLRRGRAELIARQTHPTAFDQASTTHVAMNGQDGTEEILNVPCYGIQDTQRLRAIAESLYEEIGRQELEGSFETKNLASFKGDSYDPDLLRLRVGDAVEMLVDARRISATSPLVTTLMETEHLPAADVVERIRARVGDVNLARAIVATARGSVIGQLRYFRIAGIKYDWGIESGVSISCDFHNYFTPRADIGEAPRPRHRARPRAAQAPATGNTTTTPLVRSNTPLAPMPPPSAPPRRP